MTRCLYLPSTPFAPCAKSKPSVSFANSAAFLGNASKKGKGKKGKAGASTPAQTDQKLNHSLDMIEAFSKLKVPL